MTDVSIGASDTKTASAMRAPGPRGLPWFGSVFPAWRDPLTLFMESRVTYGDVVRFKFGPFQYYLVNDPNVVKHVLVDKGPKGETKVSFSQPHAIDLADINGDGLMDIVTGKRFWAHGPKGDADPNAWPVAYWFELKRDGGKASFIPHLIDANSGVGTQVMAVDINGDKKLDVVVGNKRGTFYFRHEVAKSK